MSFFLFVLFYIFQVVDIVDLVDLGVIVDHIFELSFKVFVLLFVLNDFLPDLSIHPVKIFFV